jgi:hypothetical protein
MGGPRLTPEEVEKRQREKQRKSLLFQRIRQFFKKHQIEENVMKKSHKVVLYLFLTRFSCKNFYLPVLICIYF